MNITIMRCGGCDAEVTVTEAEWNTLNVKPCGNCDDGGVDLVHARRHADDW